MLRHPALLPALPRGYAQSEALFALKHVAAVIGIKRPYGVVFRELDDIAVFFIHVKRAMQTLYEIFGTSELVKCNLTHAGHNVHVEHYINAVGKLHADLREWRAHLTHNIGHYIHGAPLHSSPCKRAQAGIHLVLFNPVVGGACHLFFRGADKSARFYSCHVVGLCAVKKAPGKLFFVKAFHKAGGNCLLLKGLYLLFALRDPDYFIGRCKRRHFVNP